MEDQVQASTSPFVLFFSFFFFWDATQPLDFDTIMTGRNYSSPLTTLIRLATARPTILIIRRLAFLLLPILAVLLFIKSLSSIPGSGLPKSLEKVPFISTSESPISDHEAIHGQAQESSKGFAWERLIRALDPKHGLIPVIDRGSLYQIQRPLEIWRKNFITENFQDKLQDPSLIGSLALVPSANDRRKIYTYFDKTDDNSNSYHSELAILETWKRAWYAMGFAPAVLTSKDAEKHPQYSAFVKHFSIPDKKSDVIKSLFSSFLAWSSSGGGILCNYRAFPMTRNFDNQALKTLRESTVFNSPISFIESDSALIVADELSSITIVSDLIQSFSKGEDLYADAEKLMSKLQGSFEKFQDDNDTFAYYSDKNLNLVSFGLFEENFGNVSYDPAYALVAIKVHLHQTFLNAYSKGVVYVDPISATFTQKYLNVQQRAVIKAQREKELTTMTEDKFNFIDQVVKEEGFPNYNAFDVIALSSKKIASDLNKCPTAKYGSFANLCRPTFSTINKIHSLVSGDKKSKKLKHLRSTDVCNPLPCSTAFGKSLKELLSINKNRDDYSNLNKPAKIRPYLPNPTENEVFSISVVSHPLTMLYMCMGDPQAIPFLDYARFFISRNGLTNGLAGDVFKDGPYISPSYKVTHLKDSMYQYPAKSNVSWIPIEVDAKTVGTLMEWEIGFTPLRELLKVGDYELSFYYHHWMDKLGGYSKNKNYYQGGSKNIINSIENEWENYYEPIEQTKSQLGTRLEMVERLIERHVIELISSNKDNKMNNKHKQVPKKREKILATVRPIPGKKDTTILERLALIDALHKWSPADGEILTFLRLWTEKKFTYLKKLTEGQIGTKLE